MPSLVSVITRPSRNIWIATTACLLTAVCGGESERASHSSDPQQPQEEISAAESRQLDVLIRLEEALAVATDEVARLEADPPDLAGEPRAKLLGEMGRLRLAVDKLQQAAADWSEAGTKQRRLLLPKLESLLVDLEQTLERVTALRAREASRPLSP